MPSALIPSRIRVPRVDVSFLTSPLFQWDKVNQGTRSWSWAMGVDPVAEPELFVRRAIIGVAQQFNFWQDRRSESKDFSADTVWKWVRNEIGFEDMCLNLVDIRKDVHNRIECYVSSWARNGLVQALLHKRFWTGLNRSWNPIGMEDPVLKKVILLKMILEDSGFTVYRGAEWGHACVDYNVLVVLNHFGILPAPGGLWQKAELDLVRLKAYWVCVDILSQLDVTPSALDGVMFFAGRELRKQFGEDIVPKVLNEANY